MPTQIEILGGDGRNAVRVAFYYPVPAPQQQAKAIDANRAPAGTRLSAQEIADLKAGTLVEVTQTFNLEGMTGAQIQSYLVERYAAQAPDVLAFYKQQFSWVGRAYDGSSWS